MTYRGVCTSNRDGITSGSNTTVRLTFPPGTAVGDTISCVVDTNAGSGTVTATSGTNTWTPTDGPVNQSNVILAYLFVRTLDAIDVAAGSVLFTWTAGTRPQAMGDGFYGVTMTSYALNQGVGSTLTLPSVTTTADGSDVSVNCLTRVVSGAAATVTFPAGWTKDGTSSSNYASGANVNAVAGHRTTPGAAGSYGGGTITTSPSASHMLAYTVALAPTATPSGGSTAHATAAATGAGTKTGKGGSTSHATAAAAGAGSKVAAGGASTTATATATGTGTSIRAGGSTATAAAASSGTGVPIRQGGSTTSVLATATGGGINPGQPGGGSTAHVTARATGAGTAIRAGGSPAGVAASSSGDGVKVAQGGSTALAVAHASGGGKNPGVEHDYEFAAAIAPRLWTAELEPGLWSASIDPRPWTGGIE